MTYLNAKSISIASAATFAACSLGLDLQYALEDLPRCELALAGTKIFQALFSGDSSNLSFSSVSDCLSGLYNYNSEQIQICSAQFFDHLNEIRDSVKDPTTNPAIISECKVTEVHLDNFVYKTKLFSGIALAFLAYKLGNYAYNYFSQDNKNTVDDSNQKIATAYAQTEKAILEN